MGYKLAQANACFWYIAAFVAGALITNIILDRFDREDRWADLPLSTNVEDRRR